MLCHLCLYECKKENQVDIFKNGEESHLTKLIARYMHIEVTLDRECSQVMCNECFRHLDEFHKFVQFVDQRQHALQNEFLEVKCVITEGTNFAESNNDSNGLILKHNEESLLDMKDVISATETPLDRLLPLAEFGYAEDSDIDDNFEENGEFENADEDDMPLQTLVEKVTPTTTKKLLKKLPQKRKYRRGKRKLTKKGKMAGRKSRTKVTNENSDDGDDDDDGDMTDGNIGKHNKGKTPEENKQRDELIAKHIRLKCEICDAPAETFKDLRSHFRSVHNTRAFVTCCGTRFRRRFVLVDHIKVHLNPDHFKCKICNKVLKSKICLDIHFANMHADKSGLKHGCTLCDRRFAHPCNLAAHMMSHTEERKHVCDICNKGFKTNYMLKVHVRAMHEQRTPYICDTCGKEYKFKPSFERHVAEHQGRVTEPTEQCSICGKWLMPNGLRRHMDRHNMKDVECHICGKIMKSKAALTGHIEYSHKKKLIYACTFCDKTFKRPCVLKEHIAMHTGQKDYNCPHCPREFRSKANMYSHIKKIHVVEWEQAQLNRNKGPSEQNEKQ